jgi:hypothetical protein
MKQLLMSKQNVLISKQNLHSFVKLGTTTCTANSGKIRIVLRSRMVCRFIVFELVRLPSSDQYVAYCCLNFTGRKLHLL